MVMVMSFSPSLPLLVAPSPLPRRADALEVHCG